MWSINGVLLTLLYVSLFISPLCVGYIWVRRLMGLKSDARTKYGWRDIALLTAQLMVTAAVALLWYWLLNHSSGAGPEEYEYLWKFCRSSLVLALAALVASLLGTGTAKKFTAASSLIVVVNWFAVGVYL